MRREIEILCLIFLGYVCLMLGLRMGDIGFRVFFYILSGMFVLAVFRPKESP
jgi:hypothetical protein